MLSSESWTNCDQLRSDDLDVRYVARQPIFDSARNVIAYELLFRGGDKDHCDATDGDAATLSTIDVSLFAGPDSLTDGLPGFVNCTRELLVNGTVTALPRDRAVLEILETVPPDAEVLTACSALKRSGYRLAIDDFAGDLTRDPLIALADIIKVDFALTTSEMRSAIATRYSRRGLTLLAEKVETQEDFESAVAMGYRYFQGYFFCKPVTIVAQDIRCLQPAYVALLATVYDQKFDLEAIEKAIRCEPSLCYRLLRYLNSAAFGVYPVRSIRHAIALLGQRELQKWISIVTAIAMAGPRSSELISDALIRAYFMEAMALRLRATHATEYFLAGMFSLIDAMLNQRLDVVLANLPLSTIVKEAVLGHPSPIRITLDLALACERGAWGDFSQGCTDLDIAEPEVWACFEDARRWVKALRSCLD